MIEPPMVGHLADHQGLAGDLLGQRVRVPEQARLFPCRGPHEVLDRLATDRHPVTDLAGDRRSAAVGLQGGGRCGARAQQGATGRERREGGGGE
jgi:hypothetical protein